MIAYWFRRYDRKAGRGSYPLPHPINRGAWVSLIMYIIKQECYIVCKQK